VKPTGQYESCVSGIVVSTKGKASYSEEILIE
jgi:hypothetical protein